MNGKRVKIFEYEKIEKVKKGVEMNDEERILNEKELKRIDKEYKNFNKKMNVVKLSDILSIMMIK